MSMFFENFVTSLVKKIKATQRVAFIFLTFI